MSTVRPELVRRTVGFRLPPGSVVVDVAWHPGSPLGSFADRYPTIAVTAVGGSVAKPALRAERLRLPFADSSVDCVLLLDLETDELGDGGVMAEARRVLCPGGLAVVSTASTRGFAEGGHDRFVRRRGEAAHVTDALIDLGLVPEQVNRIQFLLHPMKLVAPTPDRLPLLCRTLAAMNRFDPSRLAQLRRTRASSVLILGRKP